MSKDTIVYSESLGPKVLVNWMFVGQQVLFKKIFFEYVNGDQLKYDLIIESIYKKINEECYDFYLYELKDHESYSGLSYQDVVLNMKGAFDIQKKVFIDFLNIHGVDSNVVSLLKMLHFCINMPTNSSDLYYNAMIGKYLDFISKEGIKSNFESFNDLKVYYSKAGDFFKQDSYFTTCEQKNLFANV